MRDGKDAEGSLDSPDEERLASIARSLAPKQFAAVQKVLQNQLLTRLEKKALAKNQLETDSSKALTEKQLASIVEALKAEQGRHMISSQAEGPNENESTVTGIIEESSKALTEAQLASIVQALKAEQARKMRDANDVEGGLDSPEEERLASIARSLSPEQFAAVQKVLQNQLERKMRYGKDTEGSLDVPEEEERLASIAKSLSPEQFAAVQKVLQSQLASRVEKKTNDKASLAHSIVPASTVQANEVAVAEEMKAKDIKIDRLYNELRQQAAKATQLETVVAEQKAELERSMEETKKDSKNLEHVKSNYDWAVSEHDKIYKKFCDLELELSLEKDKAESYMNQLSARENEYNLRNDQFHCRFQVQNERIVDLEQQQASLYAAFELLREEVSAQDKEHSELKCSLNEADSEVARQLDGEQKRQSTSRQPVEAPASESEQQMARSLVEPSASSSRIFLDSTSNIFDQQPTVQGRVLMKGFLWKLDKIKGWKRRYFMLYGQRGVYHMSYSDGPREKVKGIYEYITSGISTVLETKKKPFSFLLNPDPNNPNTVVLNAAATNADDFDAWMAALRTVTVYPPGDTLQHLSTMEISIEGQEQAQVDHAMAIRLQRENATLV